ncbi:MAG: hypothetical protein ACP5QU_03210 [Anaerolineae bacterium]
MKVIPPPVKHASYQEHRRQVLWQIILPVGLSVMACFGLITLISLATFGAGGDVARWAAISTIWIVIPLLFAGVFFLLLLGGFIYLLARLLNVLPTYTALVQDYTFRGAARVRGISNAAVQPIFFIEGLSASLQAIFRRK